jgi:hypothetical protein
MSRHQFQHSADTIENKQPSEVESFDEESLPLWLLNHSNRVRNIQHLFTLCPTNFELCLSIQKIENQYQLSPKYLHPILLLIFPWIKSLNWLVLFPMSP